MRSIILQRITLLACLLTLTSLLIGCPPRASQQVAVPDVIGQTEQSAGTTLTTAGLSIGGVTMSFHETIPVGNVIGQHPAAGVKVKLGSKVNVTISKGPDVPLLQVFNVTNYSFTSAESSIILMGFVVGTITEDFHPTLPAGTVISQDPAAYSYAPQGSPVHLVVSKGSGLPPPPPVLSKIWGGLPQVSGLDPARNIAGSEGDTMTLRGSGFPADPDLIEVNVSGIITSPSRVTTWGTIEFPIPKGAHSGEVRIRVKPDGEWSNPFELTVVPASKITLAAGQEAGGVFAHKMGYVGFPSYPYRQGWILSGSGFSKVENPDYTQYGHSSVQNGPYDNDIIGLECLGVYPSNVAGQNRFLAVVINDNTLWVPEIILEIWEKFEDAGSIQIRAWGMEKESYFSRHSNTITLHIQEELVYENSHHIFDVRDMTLNGYQVQQPCYLPFGDWLVLQGQIVGGAFEYSTPIRVSAPFLPGEGFPIVGLRRFYLDTPGSFTVTNLDTGISVDFEVKKGGVPFLRPSDTINPIFYHPSPAAVKFGYHTRPFEDTGNAVAAGGCRVFIPAGALPPEEGPFTWSYGFDSIMTDLFDPEEDDGSSVFQMEFNPEPTRLLKPISISIPYDPGRTMVNPSFGIMDTESLIYYYLDAAMDDKTGRATYLLPAITYSSTKSDENPGLYSDNFQKSGSMPQGSLNQITRRMGVPFLRYSRAVAQDPNNLFNVNYITDPKSPSYVTDAYAESVLNTMVSTHNWLSNTNGWTPPSPPTSVSLRRWRVIGAYGSTTKWSFGSASISINTAQCPPNSDRLFTAAAHEVTHAFQRVYTTNITTKWIDEACADAVAYLVLGNNNFAETYLNNAVPFLNSIPAGFYFGYSGDEPYAAASWCIWLHDQDSNALRKIYETLKWSPGYWSDSYATFETATGKTMYTLYPAFAEDFWMHTIGPMEAVELNGLIQAATGNDPVLEMTSHLGVSNPGGENRPPMSSIRYTARSTAKFRQDMAGRNGVVRASGFGDGYTSVAVFCDSGPATIPSQPVKLGILDSTMPGLRIDDITAFINYRLIIINANKSAQATMSARVVVPQISSISPSGGRYNGGYTVSVSGAGFGGLQGQILFSGVPVQITEWTDTLVKFTMPYAGYTGPWHLNVRTAEDAASNSRTFTIYD